MITANDKYKVLFFGIILDIMGVVTSSWVLPIIGDFGDFVWAPLTAWLMIKLYKGTTGKIAGLITLVEEAAPGLDIIPTFTLMWIYTYLIQGKKVEKLVNLKE